MPTTLVNTKTDTTTSTDPYAGYERWKLWDKPFTYTREEAAYFKGETRGLAIEGARVLEIGFGEGGFLAWARDNRAAIAGIEIIPALLDAARSQNVDLLPAEFEQVASDHAGRFDTIAAFDVFEHFPLEVVVTRLKACETMLKDGGQLILRFPNAQSPFGFAPQNGDPTHRSALSRGVIEKLTQGMDLKVLRYAPSFRVRGTGLAQRLCRALRYVVRNMIAAILNWIYTQQIPWDPVVVIVLSKMPNGN